MRKAVQKKVIHDEMDFVIVTKTHKTEGTMFIHLCVKYLNALQISNEEEYKQSICVTLFDDEATAQSRLQVTNFAQFMIAWV